MKQHFLLCLLLCAAAYAVSAKSCTDEQQGRCLSTSTFCWDNQVYECPNHSYACKGEFGPCVEKHLYARTPGKWKRYQCLNNKNFQNGGVAKTCAPGTECWPQIKRFSPCLKKKHRGECPNGNGGCIDDKHYCENGTTYRCPSGLNCAGPARAPLVDNVVAPCAKKV